MSESEGGEESVELDCELGEFHPQDRFNILHAKEYLTTASGLSA